MSIREKCVKKIHGVDVNSKVDIKYLGDYLIMLEGKIEEQNKKWQKLMDEVVRIGSLCTLMDKRIGLRTERAEKMGVKKDIGM